MAKPFCSTGEHWDKEVCGDNPDEIWQVFHDKSNGDTVLWLYPSEDTSMELRMTPYGAYKLAKTLMKSVSMGGYGL